MKDLIHHGIPKHDYFAIAVPVSWLFKSYDTEGGVITLQDPKTQEKTKVQIMETWLLEMDEFIKLNGFSLLTYGITSLKLATVLRAKYPEIDQSNQVRYVLLKKL